MKLLRRLRALFRKEKLDAEMSEELRAHLELQAAENEKRGMAPDEARYAAQRSFGGVEQIKERARDARQGGFLWLEHLRRDLNYAVRQLRRGPGFTAVVVLTLALGIGANTAIFMVVNALLWRPLPVPEPERLVVVQGAETYARFDRFRHEVQSLSGVFAVGHLRPHRLLAPALGIHAVESTLVQEVSGDFFAVLGRPALLGRTLVADDDRAGAPQPVVVLSHAYWQRRFHHDPAVLGKDATLNHVPVTIVGVMPPGFFGVDAGHGGAVDFWCPLWLKTRLAAGSDAQRLTINAASSGWLHVMGRLKSDVTLAQARAELATMTERDRAQAPKRTALRVQLGATGYTWVRGEFRQPLNVLWAIAGIVLAIACANVGGLLLARGALRQREFAVRLALGAGRGRLLRQLVTESLLLAMLGSALGLLLAQCGVSALQSYMGGTALDLRLDPRLLGFTLVVAMSTGLAFGIAPALRFSRLDLTQAFQARAVTGGRSWLNRGLVVMQIALAFVLLAGAGLFARTLQNLRALDGGFARDNVLQFTLGLGRESTETQRDVIHRRMLDALEALPGVQSVTASQGAVFGAFTRGGGYVIDGPNGPIVDDRQATFPAAGRRYFETKGIALLHGRDFTAQDDQANAPRVAVISESVTKKHFRSGDPLGRIVRVDDEAYTIVGVARDSKIGSVRKPAEPSIHLSFFHQRDRALRDVEFTLRTQMDARRLGAVVRAVVLSVAPAAEVSGLTTVKQMMDFEFMRERAIAELAGFFSTLAVTLAGLGLYGLIAFGMAQRTREIGVRMALGADRRDVLALVVRSGLHLAAVGCAVGAIAAAMLARLIAKLLYGVGTADPMTLAATAGVLLLVALLASWLPARRATKVDPAIALRAE